MVNTISGEGPWEYIDLLNECIRILLTVLIGAVFSRFHVFDAKTFVPIATGFVFYLALPLHVARGIGIGIDFYDDSFSWVYIASFLILRIIALVVSVLAAWFQGESIGQMAVIWLSLSWISTIILGIPISTAVFGSPTLGARYGLLAAISSFIFQLPLQLLFLECHSLEKESCAPVACDNADIEDVEAPGNLDNAQETVNIEPSSPSVLQATPDEHEADASQPQEDLTVAGKDEVAEQAREKATCSQEEARLSLWLKYFRRTDIWRKILIKLCQNPVMWGIVVGFVLSLSTAGPRFLNPTSDDYVPGLGWIWTTAEWLGDCVSPVSLITTGVWMQNYKRKLLVIPFGSASLYMMAKLVLIPAIMVGLAKGLDFDDNAGRAAVLIAALPISMASFTLSTKYDIGQADLAANVALGTALLLPTILLWNLFLDAVDLFPITKVG